ncbi:acetyl-CoA carboxylase biotin carboxylase subunit family protein [Sulfitobacter sp. 1A12126]|uniref:ATP-grasp domain-containing protein n=1 Tax=Sulfitobacter sp. 1A12126 TaxID=3368591 RepID=UPI003746F4E0
MASVTKNQTANKLVCIVGSDAFHQEMIGRIPEAKDWQLEQVLHRTDVQPNGTFDFDTLLNEARAIISGFDRPPDAIIGHLDFPVSALVSLLCRDHGLIAASPEAVARCEHKYWMRQYQQDALPDDTPRVVAINPFDPDIVRKPPLPLPFWLKPVKGHSSMLGYRVREASELTQALSACRRAIHRYGEPFNAFLKHLDPAELPTDKIDGNYAVAEELISEDQLFTLEGYRHKGETTIYGVVESRRSGRHMSSLSSYYYPAELPGEVVEAAQKQVTKVLAKVGFDNGPFNVEFFHDPETGALNLLEINTRLSKSHAPLFEIVDGCSHHKQIIQLALGQTPDRPKRQGTSPMAAKFMVRSHEANGVVHRIPCQEEIDKLRALMPDLKVQLLVGEGQNLSELVDQDSYSFELMDVFLGGESADFIEDAYKRCRDSLVFLIKPMDDAD